MEIHERFTINERVQPIERVQEMIAKKKGFFKDLSPVGNITSLHYVKNDTHDAQSMVSYRGDDGKVQTVNDFILESVHAK